MLSATQDEQVWAHLESVRISPVFYTVRWLTLMLAQELHMPDTIRPRRSTAGWPVRRDMAQRIDWGLCLNLPSQYLRASSAKRESN